MYCVVEEGEDTGARKKEVTDVGRSSYYFGIFYFGVDSISKEVMGFSPFMVSPRKNTVSLSLVFDCCAYYSLS